MKRKIILLMLLVCVFSNVFSDEITKTYQFDAPKVLKQQDYDLVKFSNTLLSGIKGQPALPYKDVSLLLPPGHEATSIHVKGKGFTKINQKIELYPWQPSKPLPDTSNTFFIDQTLYQKDVSYPYKNHGVLTTEYMNGYAFALSVVTPVIYNPAKKEFGYYKSIEVTINTKLSTKANQALQNLKQGTFITKKVAALLQNPGMINTYPRKAKNDNEYQILIITHSSFEDSFDALTTFYQNRGLESQIVTKQYISDNMSGQDIQEKMRNYIIQEYQNNGVEFVLLAGDVEYIPYRGFYCQVQSSSVYEDDDIPADLYFSALDGNWDDDGDGLWGEPGEEDLLPDIAVARFSFSNQTELDNMIEKSTSYQSNPVLGELTQPLLAGEHLWSDPLTWGAQYLDLIHGWHDDNGYTTQGIPEHHNYDTLYARDLGSWSGSTLMNKINNGISFLHHVGHASQTSAMHLYNGDITNSNFSQVNGTDHNYSLVYTHGCLCGSFDYDDCIAEKMVSIENFAATFIGNSRYGWFNEGQTEGPSQHIHREFVNALYGEGEGHVGEAHLLSKVATAPWVTAPGQWEPGALRWCFYDCNVLGDPAMLVWTEEPFAINASYPANIEIGSESITIALDTSGTAIEGIYCVFKKDDEILGSSRSDETGNALIEFDQPVTSVGEAELLVYGYNSLENTYNIDVIPNNGPYVVLNTFAVIDGNNNIPEFDESIQFDMNLENLGQADATSLTATLRSQDGYMEIVDSIFSIGTINSNSSTDIAEAFEVIIADDIPDQYQVEFQLLISDATGEEWISGFSIVVNAPSPALSFLYVDGQNNLAFTSNPVTSINYDENYHYQITVDTLNGNNNNCLDPGETADMVLNIMNNGSSTAPSASCSISTPSDYITINTPTVNLGNVAPGDLIEQAFSITVDEATPIGTAIDFDITLESGNYSTEIEVTLKVGLIIEDFETGDFSSYNWQMGGNADWVISSGSAYEGDYSAQSGSIDDDQYSEISITVDVLNNDSIKFYKKVSSESSYDYLRFYIDGYLQEEWSGDVSWSQEIFNVTEGTHTFTWKYEKDISVSSGNDCAWLDYIELPAHADAKNSKMDITISCTEKPSWMSFTDIGDGTAELTGTPGFDNLGEFQVELLAEDGDGHSVEQFFVVNVSDPEVITGNDIPGIKIYPNPAKGNLNILLNEHHYLDLKVLLLNSFGQVVKNIEAKCNIQNQGKIVLNLAGINPGMYYLQIQKGSEFKTYKVSVVR